MPENTNEQYNHIYTDILFVLLINDHWSCLLIHCATRINRFIWFQEKGSVLRNILVKWTENCVLDDGNLLNLSKPTMELLKYEWKENKSLTNENFHIFTSPKAIGLAIWFENRCYEKCYMNKIIFVHLKQKSELYIFTLNSKLIYFILFYVKIWYLHETVVFQMLQIIFVLTFRICFYINKRLQIKELCNWINLVFAVAMLLLHLRLRHPFCVNRSIGHVSLSATLFLSIHQPMLVAVPAFYSSCNWTSMDFYMFYHRYHKRVSLLLRTSFYRFLVAEPILPFWIRFNYCLWSEIIYWKHTFQKTSWFRSKWWWSKNILGWFAQKKERRKVKYIEIKDNSVLFIPIAMLSIELKPKH